MIVFLSSLLYVTTFIPGLVQFGLNAKQGLYGQGKLGKCPFHLGQGRSGKLAMVRGNITFVQ